MGDWTMDLIYKPDVVMIKKQLLVREEGQRGLVGEEEGEQEQVTKKESKKSGTSSNEQSHQQQPSQNKK